ncbi:hypothetical protein D9757_000881 [Collybiopsis confluens]|uniref:Zn(2)-C6 fungal-type domain-containing protein n=1 Tax=Collybiopsis confluens TaxID=2823264 RepID=A0A8H5I089_9AGAR|nr:hypothetical protein D9757_000881 [Collybiopsis confluens]
MPVVASSAKAPSRRKEKLLSPEELKEIDQKRLKGELSCAECRRLKLRCDKKVPCSSCVRRGCESICPCGILEAGIGTRFILASTTQLHSKISLMSSRIRALEDAVAIFQSSVSSERHPLLDENLLSIKFGSEAIHEEGSPESSFAISGTPNRSGDMPVLDAFGTLALGEEGEMKYFGRSAGSETLILASQQFVDSSDDEEDKEIVLHKTSDPPSSEPSPPPLPSASSFSEEDKDGVSPEIYALALDIGQGDHYFTASLAVTDLLKHLPNRSRGDALAHSYIEHASLFFRAMKRDELFENMLPAIYSSLNSPLLSSQEPRPESDGSASGNSPNILDATKPGLGNHTLLPSPHHLAVLFFIFALGSFFELSASVKKYVSESEMWFELGRSALICSRGIVNNTAASHNISALSPEHLDEAEDAEFSLSSGSKEILADWTPKVLAAPSSSAEDTVQALGLMATYCSMSGKKYARDSAWCGMSLAAKVAQSSGMHRDPSRWHMDPKTVQRRRALWWEVCSADISHSVALGRPPSIHLSFVDCEFPTDEEATLSDSGEEIMGLWCIKYTFAKESFTPVINTTLTAKSPSYSAIMDLDKKIRQLALPAGLKPYVSLHEDGPEIYYSSHLALRDFYASQFRTVTMLYLHRSFFAHAMLTHPSNPLMSPFAPSFLAAYRAASVIIKAAIHFYDRCPAVVPRIWFLTYHVFSAAVTVGTVVKRSPNSSIARSALSDLGQALDLFEKCAYSSTRNRIAFTLLRKLKERADKAYKEYIASSKDKLPTPATDLFSSGTSFTPSSASSERMRSVPQPGSGTSGTPSAPQTESNNIPPPPDDLDPSLFSKSSVDTPDDEDELAIWGGQTRLTLLNHNASGNGGSRTKGKGKEHLRSHSKGLSVGSLGSEVNSRATSPPTSSPSLTSPLGAALPSTVGRNPSQGAIDPLPISSDTAWNDVMDAQMSSEANLDVPIPLMPAPDSLSIPTHPQFGSSLMDVAMTDMTGTDFDFDLGRFGLGGGTAGSQGFLMDMALDDNEAVNAGPSPPTGPGSRFNSSLGSNSATSRPWMSESQLALMEYLSGSAEAMPLPGASFGSLGGTSFPWGPPPPPPPPPNPNSSFNPGSGTFDLGRANAGRSSNAVSDPAIPELHTRFVKYLGSKRQQQQQQSADHLSQMLSRSAVEHPTSTVPVPGSSWISSGQQHSVATAADGDRRMSFVPSEDDYAVFFESLVRPGEATAGSNLTPRPNGHDPLNLGPSPSWNANGGALDPGADFSWAAFMDYLTRSNYE